ncbi:Bug family tripartite tricarboxylate transporter substrate binding protein [Cupriavidus neocaledonicus]|uniref:Putative extra-cytoplasmic solute receptor n=1 Tax=Cupriavidus neocaledonicus TaxID=1040979 RepID=A0A375HVB5_9BURK|nr:tripartite tricarboxylate transporter substrate binding protein [Cupriavidus neocaledonicus]SPD60667.1 putative extra-cytoplasmic solute receptor [Cupriavidus neocaledonicus]
MPNKVREPVRRIARRAALAALAIPLAASLIPAHAQTWTPVTPIRLIVPYGPGGSSDAIARVIAAEMSKGLGQQVVVDNKGGGQGVIAMQETARAAPDGYTLVLGHVGTLAVNPAMMRKLPYDPLKDFTPVTLLAKVPMVFAVGPTVHSDSIKAFIAQARAKPGAMTYGSAGNGSAGNVAFEMLKQTARIDLVHVPYKGTGAQITDLLAGNIDAASAGLAGILQHAKAGKLRILAVGSSQRLAPIPSVPTIAEEGYPGFESSQWFGLMAPARTPTPVVSRLHAEAVKALSTPLVRQRLAEDASTPVGGGSAEFASFIRTEQQRWGTVIRSAGIQAN